jgi:uncharacterized membrane protein YgcG
VDVHLVLNKIRLGERYVELTRHEEHVSLHSVSIEITGGARVNSGGMRRFQTGGGEAGGGGATFLAASWFAMTARNLFRVSVRATLLS